MTGRPQQLCGAMAVFVFAVLAVVLASAPRAAFGAPETATVPVETDATDYPVVSVTFDAPAGSVDALTVATVVESGRPRVATMQGAGHGGVEIALVFDTSASVAGEPLQAMRAAAKAFIERMPAGTNVAVVAFDESAHVLSPMTSEKDRLHEAIGQLRPAGDAALNDAVALGIAQFVDPKAPRTVVLVSDGGKLVDRVTTARLTSLLRDGGIRLYGLQLVTGGIDAEVLHVAVDERRALDTLAVRTNGRTVDAGAGDDLPSAYRAITDEALQRVRVTYVSSAHGSTPVVVRLTSGSASRTVEVDVPLPDVSDVAPVLGGIAIFVALLVLGAITFLRPRHSLLAASRRRDWTPTQADFKAMKGKAGELFERSLERRDRKRALGTRLENAGVALRPGEYVVLTGTVAGVGMVFGMMLGGVVLALLLGAGVLLGARLVVSSRTSKRRAALERQLPDFLQQVTSGLRAGYGVLQAIDAVSREIDAPMSDELRRLVAEVQLGRDASDALRGMAARIDGQDVDWVVQAIEINREVGGDLVEVLEAVGDTIRARDHLRRQVKTLSAQGRLSARILMAMPFVMALLISMMSPGYLKPLVEETFGPFLITLGGVLMATGWVWLRRIIRPQF